MTPHTLLTLVYGGIIIISILTLTTVINNLRREKRDNRKNDTGNIYDGSLNGES